uniref:Mitochondrial pyruvate carrier n=1 Tax=Sinocyclocheilus rhinocerous TaxID=307959 RepID=A0A673L1T9_9TELE
MAIVGLRASYHRILDRIEHMLPAKLRPVYNHPAGPKTVFFWAPMFKWGLVIAGLADMTRPADKLSTSQSAVLTATGLIWSRYSLVIIPKNWNLFAVNFFVGVLSFTYRIHAIKSLKWGNKQKVNVLDFRLLSSFQTNLELTQTVWQCSALSCLKAI